MKYLGGLVLLAVVVGFAVPTNAAIVVDDWKIDLSKVTGENLSGVLQPIDEILFTGFAWSQTTDTNNDGLPTPGERAQIKGLLHTLNFSNDILGAFSPGGLLGPDDLGLNATWQLSFDFDVEIQYLAPGPLGMGFEHVAAGAGTTVATGKMNWYIDGPVVTPASAGQPAGNYTDGVKIATFSVTGGDFGQFNFAALDGQDDATFTLDWAMAGVLLDKDGNDLGDLVSPATLRLLALTDSNLDADPLNTGTFGNVPGIPTGFGPVTPETPINFVAKEDGSSRLGVVPEPTSLLTWGLLTFFAAFVIRRKRR